MAVNDGNGVAIPATMTDRVFRPANGKPEPPQSMIVQADDRFADLLEERQAKATTPGPIRLNIGGGETEIPGFLVIDRKIGLEAYPLDWPDNSVEEIRASHVLEHFPHNEIPAVLCEWARVLKPGGRMRIAVPDWEWLRRETRDPKLMGYIYGGQVDENDFHKCGFNESSLTAAMEAANVGSVSRWKPDYPDCSAHPCSLNLQGYKGWLPGSPKKTVMVSSVPRLGFQLIAGCKYESLMRYGTKSLDYTGAYFHQCLENALEDVIEDGHEWAITHDYDTAFGVTHIERLFRCFEENPFMDALAPLQVMRNGDRALLGLNQARIIKATHGRPFQVDTAHFGLTVIRLAALKTMPKPWFQAKPNMDGRWREFRVDADIYFWNQWKECGRTLYIDPTCRVGHVQEMVVSYDDNMQIVNMSVADWRERNGFKKREV